MHRCTTILTGALALLMAAVAGAQAMTVYIAEGSAGEALVVDAGTDTVIGRLAGLPDIHGLGAAAGARYLVAGSYAETSPDQASAVARPAGVLEAEHAGPSWRGGANKGSCGQGGQHPYNHRCP